MFGHKDYKAIEKKVPTAPYTHTYKAVLLLLLVKFLVQIYIYIIFIEEYSINLLNLRFLGRGS